MSILLNVQLSSMGDQTVIERSLTPIASGSNKQCTPCMTRLFHTMPTIFKGFQFHENKNHHCGKFIIVVVDAVVFILMENVNLYL